METVFGFVLFIGVIFVIIYLLIDKCPYCKKRGGVIDKGEQILSEKVGQKSKSVTDSVVDGNGNWGHVHRNVMISVLRQKIRYNKACTKCGMQYYYDNDVEKEEF